MKASPRLPRSVIARRRRRRAGFTLVELTVSLLAGLLVAIAIVGLSKEATRSFHEEVRASAAEASLRTAIDRLRADLARASYMSTANIFADPRIAHVLGGPNVAANTAATYPGIGKLQGVRLYEGSPAQNSALGLTLSSWNGAIAPDKIEIAGNMTGSEQFEIQGITPLAAGGTCTTILLSTQPAAYRVLNNNNATNEAGVNTPTAAADTEMANLFHPSSDLARQFIVRIVDNAGCTQYLPTCKGVQTAGLVLNGAFQPYVLVTGAPIMATDAGTVCGVQGNAAGQGFVNPVQVVRWEILGPAPTGADQEPQQDVTALGNQFTGVAEAGAGDPNKYDLTRMYLDAAGNVVPDTEEVVAEYAVDLDFAFTVDTSVDTTGGTPTLTTYDFDSNGDTHNQLAADDATTGTKPQRIRSIRVRLVTRAAQADRSVNIPLTDGGVPYIYRYCLQPGGCNSTTALQWARARTVTTEVALRNQARYFY
ncbi:MAG TPA: hypothetical protein VKU41_29285 [Polyangiaceae bacterium]|nr:hypothetical protein [Polyangiaceae bacterium]